MELISRTLTNLCRGQELLARDRPIWEVTGDLLYTQAVKEYRRRKLTYVLRRVLLGTATVWGAAIAAAGTRVSINTAFVERLNLTLR